jgi:hypothetical protein
MIRMIKSSIPSPTRSDVDNPPGSAVVAVVAVAGPIRKAELSLVIAVSSELMSELGATFPEPSESVQCTQYSL